MKSRTTWAKHVSAWKADGLSAREYAARHGMPMSTLKWWSWKLKRERPGFVRVVTRPAAARDSRANVRKATLTIVVGDARVVVDSEVDTTLLATVLGVLRENAR